MASLDRKTWPPFIQAAFRYFTDRLAPGRKERPSLFLEVLGEEGFNPEENPVLALILALASLDRYEFSTGWPQPQARPRGDSDDHVSLRGIELRLGVEEGKMSRPLRKAKVRWRGDASNRYYVRGDLERAWRKQFAPRLDGLRLIPGGAEKPREEELPRHHPSLQEQWEAVLGLVPAD